MTETLSGGWLSTWSPSTLAVLSTQMSEAERLGSTYHLDLSDRSLTGGASASATRLTSPSMAVLSNLLLGRFRQLPMTVELPSSRSLNLQLARGGLFFALSNRGEVDWSVQAPDQWQVLATAWAHPFHPSDATTLRTALVDPVDMKRDSWLVRAAFQRYLLSVVHPHRRPALTIRDDMQRVVRRWLSSRLNITQGSDLVETLLESAEIAYEIVVNISDHAGLTTSTEDASLGQLYATLGGGRYSHNRLHFSAMDNGVGMVARVNERFTDRVRSSDEALVESVKGQLPRRTGGRGVGLSRVREIAAKYAKKAIGEEATGGGSIRILSNGDREDDAVALYWPNADDEPTVETLEGVPIRGTIVSVSLSLERRTDIRDDTDQLELKFAEPTSASAH